MWEPFTLKKQRSNTPIWLQTSLQLQAEARRDGRYATQRFKPMAAAQHIIDNTQSSTNSRQLFDLHSCDSSLRTSAAKIKNTHTDGKKTNNKYRQLCWESPKPRYSLTALEIHKCTIRCLKIEGCRSKPSCFFVVKQCQKLFF